eukprot:CAMPEP_0119315198 /NCGR_PEP_ID=MMETSP1333-20130426/34829_1 /TAXON_ID=418940 /ORGANISM="Scyphosphaera apsteinii, Strain RCC1455" /LENGTH=464 /DNA_ID=CAMNT_0007320481 /DNA_START=96 /DNA_END=1487 /DNA_ORIENTATION=+
MLQPALVLLQLTRPGYETHWFNQPMDHFHFSGNASKMWKQRYLLNGTFWGRKPLPNACKGPILFYTGNEGPIDAFWASNGFMTEVLAPRLGALIIFGEERYYGQSLPTGLGGSFKYLSTEQVLADYANLLTHLKEEFGAENCPVVSFGGSYGGTLTTLFRLKYPHVVVGGLAASAPLGYYSPGGWAARGVTQTTWFEIVKRVYSEAGPNCFEDLVGSVQEVNRTMRIPAHANALAKLFGLCGVPTNVDGFIYWITEALESIPQVDYPEPSGSLPGYPVNATCDLFSRPAPNVFNALAQVTKWFYGMEAGCTPVSAAVNEQVAGGVPGDGPSSASAWGFQSCSETLHGFSTVPGAWRSYQFDAAAQDALCQKYFGVSPRLGWLELWSGGYNIPTKSRLSNVIWSNGRRDPWHGGGFLRPTDAVPGGAVFVMEQTAHHQDLRRPTTLDPPELTAVRMKEEALIRSW